ncbi:cell division protein PerM [Nocardia arizonensis]|uniref:cell division protein PerM n=1 Tax=Nocardia arizonensis TaxID=1141647 RepID=UPI0006D1B5F0|nr:DUF6350 family protein [Nocardia arizonensis]
MSSTRNPPVRRDAGGRGVPDDGPRRARPGMRRSGRDREPAGPVWPTGERARALLFVAARTSTTALAVIVTVVLVVLLSADSGLDGISGAIAAGWLTAHQVPLVIGKTALGLLPLLPTAVLMWLTGRDCARAVEPESTPADLGWIVGAALSGPLLVTAVCLAVAEDASAVVALQPPNSLVAFAWVIALYLTAALVGIASRDRRVIPARALAPEWLIAGVYGAGRTLLRLLGCAAAVTAVSFLVHWSRLGDTYAAAGGAVGFLGLTLLSLAYAPNAVIGAVGVLMGPGVGFGEASVGVFSVRGGPIPAVPLIAVLPTGPAQGWWPVLLVVPAAVAVLGGIDMARISADQIRRPWATLSCAGLATLGLLLLAAIAGGDLGSFGHVGLDLPIFALASFVWLALAGYAGMVFGRLFIVPVGTLPARSSRARDRDAAYTGPGYRSREDDHADPHEEGHYEDDGYDDGHYDDGGHYDGEHYDGGHYDGGHYDESDDYRDDDYRDEPVYADTEPAPPGRSLTDLTGDYSYRDDYEGETFVAELLDEQPVARIRPPRSVPAPEIVDAEVVEPAPGDRGSKRGR